MNTVSEAMGPQLHPIWLPWLWAGGAAGAGRAVCAHTARTSPASKSAWPARTAVTPERGNHASCGQARGVWCIHHLKGQLRAALEAEVLQFLLFLCFWAFAVLGLVWGMGSERVKDGLSLIRSHWFCANRFEHLKQHDPSAHSPETMYKDGHDSTVPITLKCNYCHALQQWIGEYMAINLHNKDFYTHGNDQFPQ